MPTSAFACGTDQYGTSATGSVSVTVNNPAIVINGPARGNATIKAGPSSNIDNAFAHINIESGGNDVISADAGSATVTTGAGDVIVNLNGKNNTVNGGNGNDTVNILSGGNNSIRLGTCTDRVVEAAGTKG